MQQKVINALDCAMLDHAALQIMRSGKIILPLRMAVALGMRYVDYIVALRGNPTLSLHVRSLQTEWNNIVWQREGVAEALERTLRNQRIHTSPLRFKRATRIRSSSADALLKENAGLRQRLRLYNKNCAPRTRFFGFTPALR